MHCYTVFKLTGTHADTMAAIGAAGVLRHLGPRIVELEDRFEVRLPRRLKVSDFDAVEPGFSYLERPKKTQPGPETTSRRRRASASPAAGVACAVPADHRMYAIVARLKAYAGPNRVVSRYARMPREDWAGALWKAFEGRREFVCSSPLVQLFNPHAACGYALLKPKGTRRSDKTKNRWAEPFHEWLRFRGYFDGCAGWFSSSDLRLFCPIPGDIAYEQFAALAGSFRELRLGGTGIKMDCRAVLCLTRSLIQDAPVYRPPRQLVRGLWVTNYKDMGQAHKLMSIDQLAIPDWADLRTSADAELWLRMLDEHDAIVRRLIDSHSDEFALLKQYRRTFQARPEEAILELAEFLMNYGALLFKRRAQDHWSLLQFTVGGVAPILERDRNLRGCLSNPGFQAVAAAIRSSTVGAQGARHSGKPDHREIRYGLLTDIRRAGLSGTRELLETVFCFVHSFNREAIRRRTMGLASMTIRDYELEAFQSLVAGLPAGFPLASIVCGVAACLPGSVAAKQPRPELAEAMST